MMEDFILTLDVYERDNLAGLLELVRTKLQVLNTGDWVNQILYKLTNGASYDPEVIRPNIPVDSQAKDFDRRYERLPSTRPVAPAPAISTLPEALEVLAKGCDRNPGHVVTSEDLRWLARVVLNPDAKWTPGTGPVVGTSVVKETEHGTIYSVQLTAEAHEALSTGGKSIDVGYKGPHGGE